MTNNILSATWYEITKDIIIPLLGVMSTIIIGTIIAVLLKRNEEKAKIKALLIDNYMVYLNKRVGFVNKEILTFTYEVLKEISSKFDVYFESTANDHIPIKLITDRIDQTKEDLRKLQEEDSEWSSFTYKFSFLIGHRRYTKDAQPLENEIINNIIDNKSRRKFLSELKGKIKTNKDIGSSMNSSDIRQISDGLDSLENLISIEYNNFQFKYFKPYDEKIAQLIDSY